MKAQTRMIVVSAVVIALALTAVSGITYSWFSDTEKADITISTATIDYVTTWGENYTTDVGTGVTITKGTGTATVAVTDLVAGVNLPVIKSIENKSTVKTVYRITAMPELADKSTFTAYDLKNILIGGKALNFTYDGNTITLTETVIEDWTLLEVGKNPTTQSVYITTLQNYGGDGVNKVVAYNNAGEGTTAADSENYPYAWTSEGKTGLTIKFTVTAIQGDYPYVEMSAGEDKVAYAALPANKVVKAKSISVKDVEDGGKVSDVIVDLSNVTKYDYTKSGDEGASTTATEENIVGKYVTVGLTSIDGENNTVGVELNLKSDESTLVKSPEFNAPVVITMTVPGEFTNPVVIYNGEKEDATVISSVINGNKTTTVTFSVEHFSEYTIQDADKTMNVTSGAELKKALEYGISVKLGGDIVMGGIKNILLPETGDVSLNLNGHTITFNLGEYEGGFFYFDSFTVDDSSANKTGKIKSDDGYMFYTNSETASLTIKGGNFEIGSGTIIGTATSKVCGSIQIDGGTFTLTDPGNDYMVYASANLTVNGGTFKETGTTSSGATIFYLDDGEAVFNEGTSVSGSARIIQSYHAPVTVNGGSYEGKYSGDASSQTVVMFDASYEGYGVTVNGGEFTITDNIDRSNSTMFFGYATVNGGKFTVNECYLVINGSEVSVLNGDFSLNDGSQYNYCNLGKLSISGGTFNSDPGSAAYKVYGGTGTTSYVAEGYESVKNQGDTYTVKLKESS